MVPILLAILVAAVVFFAIGFVVKVLWWIALALIVIWLLGFLFRHQLFPHHHHRHGARG
ncbi:hydrophobic protein [Streptomyces sp. RY43-2]|uniref:Hydrophobic protein n=1 Tax=Streptomyces macrolidinus TaxID=2952607 RepID=A0ABT0ZGG8_9ACTN|nr:hydrophobic protein [Streptomyces macrolidinus]MCN9242656.1 hydrophobic protein [Streptomyces macrolidinus]